jgi:SAM-dependent methyltransferase
LWLKPTDLVFEWGAGRSTLWCADRAARVISIERNPVWHERLQREIKRRQLANVTMLLLPERLDTAVEAEHVAAVHKFNDSFDVILVDGDYRDECALAAMSRLKPGGILIIDNANWFLPSSSRSPASRSYQQGAASKTWDAFARGVSKWRVLWTSNGVTDTAIWIKPPENSEPLAVPSDVKSTKGESPGSTLAGFRPSSGSGADHPSNL